MFGQRVVAFATGVRNPKLVGRWARGEVVPSAAQAERLAYLRGFVDVLRERGEADETIRALSFGMWPSLEDRAPVEVIRNGDGRCVRDAAAAWAAGPGW